MFKTRRVSPASFRGGNIGEPRRVPESPRESGRVGIINPGAVARMTRVILLLFFLTLRSEQRRGRAISAIVRRTGARRYFAIDV